MRIRLHLAYDGADFHGWQRQFAPPSAAALAAADPDAGPRVLPPHPIAAPPDRRDQPELRTVQAVAQRALCDLYRAPITLTGASRTDAGVHALAQTAACDLPHDAPGPPLERLPDALNTRLPPDALCRHAATAPDAFDPIADCREKAYRYRFAVGRSRPLWDRRTVYHTHHALDPAPMSAAARDLVGTHDFAAFAQIDHGRESTVRTITAADVQTHATHPALVPPGRLDVLVAGTGFLYNMVRIIAGTLHDVGRGKLFPTAVRHALTTRERTDAGPTLGPSGLTLLWQRYEDPIGVVGDTAALAPGRGAASAARAMP